MKIFMLYEALLLFCDALVWPAIIRLVLLQRFSTVNVNKWTLFNLLTSLCSILTPDFDYNYFG